MKVKIKKLHPDAVIPKYAKTGDAGLDLTAVSGIHDKEHNLLVYGTGLAFEIPAGYVGLLFPRSSIYSRNISLSNSVGVIDSGFRGEVKFKFRLADVGFYCQYMVGERIGQLIILPYPQIEFEEVRELSKTERGVGGYGSTGN
jgi:dUTP pyrophosphatase